jgi:DNA invertase Pin-like site-specific DNA recombinase
MQKIKCAAYVRVSTTEQSTKAQESELREYITNRGWSLVRIYADQVSGVKSTRPALNQLLSDARKRKFSRVIVMRIDRLGRSVSNLLEILETFRSLDIEFISLSESIDTSTPTGMMVFTVLAAVASLERSILVERVKCGLAHARRCGVRLGRPKIKNLDAAEISRIRAERLKGATLRTLAKAHGTSLWSVHQLCSTPNRRFRKH